MTSDAEAKRFRELIAEITENCLSSHPADYLPFLTWIGYGNYETKLLRLGKEMNLFLQGLIQDHRLQASQSTMIDHLLSLQKSQPEYYADQMIKALVLVIYSFILPTFLLTHLDACFLFYYNQHVMVVAGTDTSAVTLDWAMSNLLNHPDILKKARAELDTHIGHRRLIDESDIPKLPYLQSLISETLRLYPAAPLLLPHVPSDACPIGDFTMPRDTMLLVNAWAIHGDPTLWDDPSAFKPVRFQNGEAEAQKFMPFGIGRRACPGAGLAQLIMGLTLGVLDPMFWVGKSW